MSAKIDDHDNPEWTETDFANAEGPEALSPAERAAFPKTAAKRGRPKSDAPKQLVTLRLDKAVIERFRTLGPGWRRAMNDALAKAPLPTEKP